MSPIEALAATLIVGVVVLGIYGRILEWRDNQRRLEKEKARRLRQGQ